MTREPAHDRQPLTPIVWVRARRQPCPRERKLGRDPLGARPLEELHEAFQQPAVLGHLKPEPATEARTRLKQARDSLREVTELSGAKVCRHCGQSLAEHNKKLKKNPMTRVTARAVLSAETLGSTSGRDGHRVITRFLRRAAS